MYRRKENGRNVRNEREREQMYERKVKVRLVSNEKERVEMLKRKRERWNVWKEKGNVWKEKDIKEMYERKEKEKKFM